MWQHFPATCLNGFLGHICHIRAGVVVQKKKYILTIRPFLMNSRQLKTEFRVDRLASFKQFVMDYPFPVSPYTASFYVDEGFFKRGVACLPALSHCLRCFILMYRHQFSSPVTIR